jgi:hypothetical protein
MASQPRDELLSPLSPSASAISDVGSNVTISSSASAVGRRRSSAVWEYFHYDEEKQESICQCVIKTESTSDGTEEYRTCDKAFKGMCLMVVSHV